MKQKAPNQTAHAAHCVGWTPVTAALGGYE